jgi:ligand-binding sensor domain-containing protein
VRCLAIDPLNTQTLYAGTDGGVFASSDGSKSWTASAAGLPRTVVYALALDPADPSRIFAGTAAGLFESFDRAKSWMRLPGSAPRLQVTSLSLEGAAGKLYTGTLDLGVIVLSLAR